MTTQLEQPLSNNNKINVCGPFRDLVPFVQLRKREKHPPRSATFIKVAGFTKSNTHEGKAEPSIAMEC